MKEIKEIKDLFTFQMDDATYDTVKSEVTHLSVVYEPLQQFTKADIKAAYTANQEDLLFVDTVIENLDNIRTKGILVSNEIVTGLMLKRKFINQNKVVVSELRKLADKLEAADTIALSESYGFATTVHKAVENAIEQKVKGAAALSDDIQATKLRAARAAATRKKNEAIRKKERKLNIPAS